MNKIFLLILLASSCFAQPSSKMKVMVLGTFHFGDSNDFKKTELDDFFSSKRQRELKQIRNQLAKFNPDKIFVENTPKYQNYWDNVYDNFLKGKEPVEESVRKNEIYQIGIKLAAELKLPKGVYCVNYMLDEPPITSNPSRKAFESYKNQVNRGKPSYEEFFKQNTLVDWSFKDFIAKHEKWNELKFSKHLLEMNKEENLRQLHYFNVLAWMDNNTNQVGTDLTSLEYYRNLQIIQNIYRNLRPSDKRLLIVIGAAHAQILKDMLKSHPVFELVGIEEFLK